MREDDLLGEIPVEARTAGFVEVVVVVVVVVVMVGGF